jgi:hypothetical protein
MILAARPIAPIVSRMVEAALGQISRDTGNVPFRSWWDMRGAGCCQITTSIRQWSCKFKDCDFPEHGPAVVIGLKICFLFRRRMV